GLVTSDDDDGNLALDQFLGESSEFVLAALREPIFDHHVSPRNIAMIAQPLLERVYVVLRRRDDTQESELHGAPRRLRTKDRPSQRAQQPGDNEGPPLHH